MRNGRRTNRINLAYLSDGYTAPELPLYHNDASSINTSLFNTTPFLEYKNFFNSFIIDVSSNASGAKHGASASDESYSNGIPVQPVEYPDNYFASSFDSYDIHRLLIPQNHTGIMNVLASNLPDYDQAFIVVNTPYYGGSGGTFSTASTNASSTEIAIHEIGHSFGELADEYWAGSVYASEKPNMTNNNNPASVKWNQWMGINNIGLYQYGSSGDEANWFRPGANCKMQFLGNPFCSVCTQAFIDKIHQDVDMIDDFSPASLSVSLINTDSVSVSVTALETVPNTIFVNWYINNALYRSNTTTIKVPYNFLNNGINTIKAEAVDQTFLSKSYLPATGYVNSVIWNVSKASILPLMLKQFSGLTKDHKGILQWKLTPGIDADHFELMKSADGNQFSLLSSVAARPGNEVYTYTDMNLLLPYTYYKLKIFLKDGSFSFSPIVRLQNSADSYSYKVYQDAQQHRYMLVTNFENAGNISFTLTDALGKAINKKDFGRVNDQLSYNFDLANYPAGIYFLKLNINNSIYTSQLVAD